MGEVIQFRDPEAELQGEELETAKDTAREYAAVAAAKGLWRGLRLLNCAPGCERLGVESLIPILAVAARAQLEEWDPE